MTLFGLPVFESLATTQIVALALVFGASFFVKGVFGYGAVPLLIVTGSFVVEPHHIVVLAALTNLLTHAQYLPDGLAHGRRDITLRLAVTLVPTIALGVWIFARMGGASLNVIAGLVILASIIADARNLLNPLAPWVRANARLAAPVFGFIAGLISGIIGAGAVSFISLFVRIFAPDKQGFRATIILVTAVILVWRSIVLAATGQATLTIALEAAIMLPGGLIAGVVGARLSRRLSDASFFSAYRLVLSVGAVAMIARGLMAL